MAAERGDAICNDEDIHTIQQDRDLVIIDKTEGHNRLRQRNIMLGAARVNEPNLATHIEHNWDRIE